MSDAVRGAVVDVEELDKGVERLDTGTGELALVQTRDMALEWNTYVGMSTRPVSDAQMDILTRQLVDGDVDIRPDGLIYMGAHRLRQRLNEAFRPGGWALRRLTPYSLNKASAQQEAKNVESVLSAEFALYAEGRFLSSARGEQKYQDNGEMTYGDACEGAKSNALSRCCKDLGIALDLWDRAFGEAWRNERCVKVWVEKKNKPQWRKLEAIPYYGERGLTDDSPNRDKYVSPAKRGREPGEDDEPARQAAPQRENVQAPVSQSRQEPSRPQEPASGSSAGNGSRIITERQGKRLWAIATRDRGMTPQEYKSFLQDNGYDSDRNIKVSDYDAMVADAENWGR